MKKIAEFDLPGRKYSVLETTDEDMINLYKLKFDDVDDPEMSVVGYTRTKDSIKLLIAKPNL